MTDLVTTHFYRKSNDEPQSLFKVHSYGRSWRQNFISAIELSLLELNHLPRRASTDSSLSPRTVCRHTQSDGSHPRVRGRRQFCAERGVVWGGAVRSGTWERRWSHGLAGR